jgi:hypothetical protein
MSERDHRFIDGCKDKCGCCNLCCLAVCDVCGLFEGALTTHCPGKPVSFENSERIYRGELNFRGGIWLAECSEHTPRWFDQHATEWREQHDVNLAGGAQ